MNWEEYCANIKLVEEELERQVKDLRRLALEFTGSHEDHIHAAIRLIEDALEELWAARDR